MIILGSGVSCAILSTFMKQVTYSRFHFRCRQSDRARREFCTVPGPGRRDKSRRCGGLMSIMSLKSTLPPDTALAAIPGLRLIVLEHLKREFGI